MGYEASFASYPSKTDIQELPREYTEEMKVEVITSKPRQERENGEAADENEVRRNREGDAV